LDKADEQHSLVVGVGDITVVLHVVVSMPSLMGVVGVNEVDAEEPLPPRDPLLGHGFDGVEGIKGCQMAGRSIGKAWQREKGMPRGTSCRKFACCVRYLCLGYL
jgi:hypothetical protein